MLNKQKDQGLCVKLYKHKTDHEKKNYSLIFILLFIEKVGHISIGLYEISPASTKLTIIVQRYLLIFAQHYIRYFLQINTTIRIHDPCFLYNKYHYNSIWHKKRYPYQTKNQNKKIDRGNNSQMARLMKRWMN